MSEWLPKYCAKLQLLSHCPPPPWLILIWYHPLWLADHQPYLNQKGINSPRGDFNWYRFWSSYLGMYFDAVVVFVTSQTLLFRLALAMLCFKYNFLPKFPILDKCDNATLRKQSILWSLLFLVASENSIAVRLHSTKMLTQFN